MKMRINDLSRTGKIEQVRYNRFLFYLERNT